MIEWLNKKEFWDVYESEYKPNGRYLNAVAYFDCSLGDIKNIAKTEGMAPEADEGDFPIPVLRWYVRANNNLALVTYYAEKESYASLDFEDDAEDIVYEVIENEFGLLGFNVRAT